MKITYYTADWCQPCHHYKPIVERLAEEYGFELEYIDLTDKHEPGIMSIPTLDIYPVPVTAMGGAAMSITPLRLVGAYPENKLRQEMEALVR